MYVKFLVKGVSCKKTSLLLGSTEIKKQLKSGHCPKGWGLESVQIGCSPFLFIEMLKKGGSGVLNLPKFFGALFVQKVGGS